VRRWPSQPPVGRFVRRPAAGTKNSKASACLDVRSARHLIKAARAAARRGDCWAAQFVVIGAFRQLAAASTRVSARMNRGKKGCALDVARAASEAARALGEMNCQPRGPRPADADVPDPDLPP